MQASHKPAADEIREEMAQMITELGLALKRIIGGAEKVNAVKYLTKPPRQWMTTTMKRILMQ